MLAMPLEHRFTWRGHESSCASSAFSLSILDAFQADDYLLSQNFPAALWVLRNADYSADFGFALYRL